MYRNFLLQQHTIAYASMIAAFQSAAESAVGSAVESPSLSPMQLTPNPAAITPQLQSISFTLDSEIPKEEIECDIEIIIVKNLWESLKKLETNLNGLHGKLDRSLSPESFLIE